MLTLCNWLLWATLLLLCAFAQEDYGCPTQLQPKDIVDSNEFLLNTGALESYVRQGIRLPDNSAGLARRLTTTTLLPITRQFTEKEGSILGAYKNIRAHCTNFTDNTWPAIIQVADYLSDSARAGADMGKRSYYRSVIDQFGILDNQRKGQFPNPDLIVEYNATLQSKMDLELAYTSNLVDEVHWVLYALVAFRSAIRKDRTVLEGVRDLLDEEMDILYRTAEDLDDEILATKESVEDLTEAFEDSTKGTPSTVKFSVFGWIAALLGFVKDLFSIKHSTELEDRIEEYKERLTKFETRLGTTQRMVDEMELVKTDLNGFGRRFPAAVSMLNKLVDASKTIAADMKEIRHDVKKPLVGGVCEVAYTQNVTVNNWVLLLEKVEVFQREAFRNDS